MRGLNKEALKISVWKGDVELTNMQLKPEALNALKLPVKVKAGFLGSVKLTVPWSRLGQDPVLVYLDRIFLVAEPATQVEGCSEDALQEMKKSRIRETELKLLESSQILKSEMNKSWLGSLIDTIIGNLKLSISNIHIRYEDHESNPGHPFAAGVTLDKLSAITVDDRGKETFVTGGALERIMKSVELEQLAVYWDSDSWQWKLDKRWEDLLPAEWSQVFKFGTKNGKPSAVLKNHSYILQPVSGNAKYSKLRPSDSFDEGQPLQKAIVNLDDVTLCLSKNGYRDILKLADNFAAFNQRLQYAHFRPLVAVKSNPRAWWIYAYRAVSDQIKKASGRMSWEQALQYTRLRKRYISLYAALLKSDLSRSVVDDNEEIEEMDRKLDIDLILQWRMLAHKFLERSDSSLRQQKPKKSWWSLGWGGQSEEDEGEHGVFSEEDLEQLNKIIGYKEGDDGQLPTVQEDKDILHTSVEVHMRHNASKLTDERECLAELSCDNFDCLIKLYPEAKIFDMKLGSYQLSSPNGLLAESATTSDSLVVVFCSKPLDADLDWSAAVKSSPCYVTYLKDSVDGIVGFFEKNTAVSQAVALETAAAVQMTIDGVKRSAQEQVNKALKDHSRFSLDLDIAAPKITIPTDFCPDDIHSTKLMLDLGNLIIRSQDDQRWGSPEEANMYLQFDLILSDVSAFLVDGDYKWGLASQNKSARSSQLNVISFLPVIDKCGVIVKFQQIHSENPLYPSTRLAVRLPSLGFHFSPARYHRLMQIVNIFQPKDSDSTYSVRSWNQADFEGWLSILSWKGVANREAVWQRRYLCLVGPFLYVLESPDSKSYKQYISLRGKQLYQVPADIVGDVDYFLAICDASRSNNKVVEDVNALVLRCDTEDSRKIWQSRLQGAVYRTLISAPITGLSDSSSDAEDSETERNGNGGIADLLNIEKLFLTGILDEFKICFDYNCQHGENLAKVLLAEECRLFEFRAIGGQVELSMKGNDIFIGMLLKSLEIEDLVCCKGASRPCYMARSFIRNADTDSGFFDAEAHNYDSTESSLGEGDDRFFEALDNLNDPGETPKRNTSDDQITQFPLSSENPPFMPPSFTRVLGLLPNDAVQVGGDSVEPTGALDSFVKAQIIIYDQNSALYRNIDKWVTVSLATLSFFCRRPTILAIMEFVNAINIKDEDCESFSDHSSVATTQQDISRGEVAETYQSTAKEEPIVKGFLGKGKSRVIFYLTLNMYRAQILLMNENGSKLVTLFQDNLLTDIKVFPSSFSIKAALGNLRISDDSLHSDHMYFWVCDMRNPGGSSFVELVFSSFSVDDEDYEGYEYSLVGQFSEVRVVYLNRFIQEVISYFMGLVPSTPKDVVKISDQVTNSEKWFTTSEVEGSPAMKLDLSLRKPIILMPRRTDSLDYLQLDVVHITVQNTFQWLYGSKREIGGIHVDILTVLVEDINLNVGVGTKVGKSIIQDVEGISIVVQRSLRDLFHRIPSIEVAVKIEKLKAVLSDKEYQIISECSLSNFSEAPKEVPPLNNGSDVPSKEGEEPLINHHSSASDPDAGNRIIETAMKVSVDIGLVELCLHYGISIDASLATVQVNTVWLLYRTNMLGEGFLSASLKGFSVIDDREGTEEALRWAIGKPERNVSAPSQHMIADEENSGVGEYFPKNAPETVPTMLILDAKFGQYLTFVSLRVQRPQLLVALDFLLAVAEFFVPALQSMVSNEGDENLSNIVDAVILDQPHYRQTSAKIELSPKRPLVADDERWDHFTYDGQGKILSLQDRGGSDISSPSTEAIIYVGSGKRLQFKNVHIKNGRFLDSCILLGDNSSYSASESDQVVLEGGDEDLNLNSSAKEIGRVASQHGSVQTSSEIIVELQAIGPELTFYNTSKDLGDSPLFSNKLLHAQLDAFGRLVLRGDTMEVNADVLGFTMESNGIRVVEPFDTSMKFSNATGSTNIHLSISDIFMNFSFSILKLFLAVENDLLSFLRMTSKKLTMVCTEFDKVGMLKTPSDEQVYVFWRPRAPPGFAVLGDYLTPIDKPPTKGVLSVNTSLVRVKRPVSFKHVWSPSTNGEIHGEDDADMCSIWFPEAPEGYVALGCVAFTENTPPPLSSTFCISASLVSPCSLRDCIFLSSNYHSLSRLVFWRVDNSLGTFLPAESSTYQWIGRAYDLRHTFFGLAEASSNVSKVSDQQVQSSDIQAGQSERSSIIISGRCFEAVASFQLIWWNQGSSSSSRKQLSIWRPILPQGMVYFGDIAIQGYEPPNRCIVLHDSGGDELYTPLDFQLVGHIKKQRRAESISFWMPQASPGYVPLGCVACKGTPKPSDFSSLRCLRSDMVTGDQFLEESVWDTAEYKYIKEPFSIWTVGNELGTFIVRSGFKKPPRRFALKLADPDLSSGLDDIIVEANIGTFSAALFDDYGGLMVPLFNISLSGINFNFHGKPDCLKSTVSFSLAARSFNDKYESWEPVIEPVDGFLRYQLDQSSPGAASQLRLNCTRDLNLNATVSNANMIFQAYASWDNLSHAHESDSSREAVSPTYGERSSVDIHNKRDYFIIPQNQLGQDIFIRATEVRGLSNIIKMPSGDMKPLRVPVLKNMLDSHLKGDLCKKLDKMVTIIIAEAELQNVEGFSSQQYTIGIRIKRIQNLPERSLDEQTARTCGSVSGHKTSSSKTEHVIWNETFFFKVDSEDGYMVEFEARDMGKGDQVGFYSASLKQLAEGSDDVDKLAWIDMLPAESMKIKQTAKSQESFGRIRCAVFITPEYEVEESEPSLIDGKNSGFIQISPTKEGPWTTVRLNYASPSACWRLGNDVVASEVSIKDGNRYVMIRSLVSVRNTTDFTLDLCLKLKDSGEDQKPLDDTSKQEEMQTDGRPSVVDEYFETETYDSTSGWVGDVPQSKGMSAVELPSSWQWIDDWHIDKASVDTTDGWVYAPDVKSLKWPMSYDPVKSVNYARRRKWVRNRKQISGGMNQQIYIGQVKPGETVPLPLSGLAHSRFYVLLLKPLDFGSGSEYSWSSVMNGPSDESGDSQICVSNLTESEKFLCCSEMAGSSSNNLREIWFCLCIQATEIAKDIRSDPIQDWTLVVKPPLSITNFLPLNAEFSVLEMQATGNLLVSSRGVLRTGKTGKVYSADIRNPLYFSLLPQRGWLPIHEAVLVSHPSRTPSKTISLRSSISGRVIQIIIEQNQIKERPLMAKIIRIYSSYWFAVARCPPLAIRLVDMVGGKQAHKIAFSLQTKNKTEVVLEEITDDEIFDGHTIASALNFKLLGISASITQSGEENYGPAKDLSPLGDMDGSLDVCAYDTDGNCMKLFLSSKPCPFQSVPTKVISIRPFMTFTNRIGEILYIKLSSEDEPKMLRASDSRVSFVYRDVNGTTKLQVRQENTDWSFPIQITKEDTISLLLRRNDGVHIMLRTEIRGYEEGSRFIVVFRLGSRNGPIRLENRTKHHRLSIRQSGFNDDAWIQLEPLSTTNFCWVDPYGQKVIDTRTDGGSSSAVCNFDLEKTGLSSVDCGGLQLFSYVVDFGSIKVVRFTDDEASESSLDEASKLLMTFDHWGNSLVQKNTQDNSAPLELIIELGVVGVSVIDRRPKELVYLYLERVFISYSTGYDNGTTSRFKLILGNIQLDNQLPLALMPVMLATEQNTDIHHPVFKTTVTICNQNPDGVQVYPYVYIRVTDKWWRLNIHEPIIWAFMDFYTNLQLDRIPQSSSTTQVDPEIRIDLIDVSEVRLKVALETAPAQRPHGILGVWSPILSAVGNAFKFQIHLRRVMRRDRFMRKSSVAPAIANRIWRDLIHNPLHLLFSVDVLGMTSSTLASLSKGFAELSTDGQFLQLRSKQVWSRRITGVGDGIMQGTEALAQGFAFGVSGVVTKPMESARQNGLLGLAHGLGRAFLGIIVQPVSGALDFFSLTVDGIGASCSKCLEVLNNKVSFERIRNPRAIHSDNILGEYCEREAIGQMVLYRAEASRHFGCTEIFKEPSKFALTDYYEDHFTVPYQRIVLVTNKRVMLLQCSNLEKMDEKPSKILWEVPWEELMAVELAKAGSPVPSHLLLHLKNFKRSEVFVRVIKCKVEEALEGEEPQAVKICSVVCKMWKAYQTHMKSLALKVPSSQRYVCFAWSDSDNKDTHVQNQAMIRLRRLSTSSSSLSEERRFVKHTINFTKVWSSELESKGRCALCRKQFQALEEGQICSIWRPVCPEGYVSVGDVAHVGDHPPNVAAAYRYSEELFALPVGYDLVWRNCPDDYISPVSIWHPRAPDGFLSLGCVAIPDFREPEPDHVYCVAVSIAEDTEFEEQKIWTAPESYPWACHLYQVKSDALHFAALRQRKEDSIRKPIRVRDEFRSP